MNRQYRAHAFGKQGNGGGRMPVVAMHHVGLFFSGQLRNSGREGEETLVVVVPAFAAGRVDQPDNTARERGLAATGFANNT